MFVPLVSNYEVFEFSNFISKMDFLDLPILDRIFTWYQPFDGVVGRLDMILISDGELWGTTSQWTLPRDVSDQFTIFLIYFIQLFGPKIF